MKIYITIGYNGNKTISFFLSHITACKAVKPWREGVIKCKRLRKKEEIIIITEQVQ